MSEALWDNMYHRLYRSITLNSDKLKDAGSIVTDINTSSSNRNSFILKVEGELQDILSKPTTSRTTDDCDFIMAITNQKNSLRGIIIIVIIIISIIITIITIIIIIITITITR